MEYQFDQSSNLSDYSKFYEEDKENMVELFFDIFKDLKKNTANNLLSDSSSINYSEAKNKLSFDLSTDLPSVESSNLSETDSSMEVTTDLPSIESSNLPETDSPIDLSTDLPSAESLNLPETDLPIDLSTNSSSLDYEMFNEEPIVDFVFDESQLYNNSNNSIKSINLPSSLTKTYDSVTDQALALEKLHNRIRNAIIDLNSQNDDLTKSISTFNRIVIQLDLHLPKLCLSPKLSNLKLNVKEYKEYLIKNQLTSSTDSIQKLVELFYESYHEFDTTLKSCKTIDELMCHSNKLQSNQEYLRNVYPEYKNLKKELSSEFRKSKSIIKLLKENIIKDLIDIIVQLTSDDSYQIFNSFTRLSFLFTFRRLLKSIS